MKRIVYLALIIIVGIIGFFVGRTTIDTPILTATPDENIYIVTIKDTGFYPCTATGCEPIARIPANTKVKFIERPFCAWVLIKFDGYYGYVRTTSFESSSLPAHSDCPPEVLPEITIPPDKEA